MHINTATTDAAKIVQRQLEDYNTRDIEAIMEMRSTTARYFEHPSTLLASGATRYAGVISRDSKIRFYMGNSSGA